MNNGSTTLAENFVYILQSLKTRSQKKTKTSLKTQNGFKTIGCMRIEKSLLATMASWVMLLYKAGLREDLG
jgi:hypothetical protein